MKAHCPSPHPKHRLLLAMSPDWQNTGLRPINTLLAALALEAKGRDIKELVWAGSEQFHLQLRGFIGSV